MWMHPRYTSAATIGLDGALETVQTVWPQTGEELLERLEARRVDGIDAALTFPFDLHQTGLAQYLEMLRHGLLGNVEMAPDLAGGTRPVTHELEDVAPPRLDECAEDSL